VGAHVQRSHAHRVVLVAPARGDADERGPFLAEHLAIVGVLARGLGALGGPGPTGGVGVGHRRHLDARHAVEHHIEPVPVIARTGMTDHGGGERR
jgi:hypothetical protein